MTSATAITTEGLGKSFLIGAKDERRTFLNMIRRAVTGRSSQRQLWAIREVSLDVRRGEILGIIGPNGAGKSTLLLVMAGILAPTEGAIRINGKTDPFFHLAAGLKPRLTVLENFSLCAALLGIPRRVFKRKLPEVLAFSGLEDYLYASYGELSTGLAARLPFATAVHADLDIILIDEMFAVGDHLFQAKCLEAFKAFQAEGKTLVLVSHNLDLIRSLCTRALYLRGGRQEFLGDPAQAIEAFLGAV